jgi:hypothetical protein
MEINGQLHAPAALPPLKAPGTHWIGGCVGPRAGFDAVEKEKNLAPAGNPARHYTSSQAADSVVNKPRKTINFRRTTRYLGVVNIKYYSNYLIRNQVITRGL